MYFCSCFAPSIEEIQKDKEFAKRLSRLQFLTPANFDIDPIHQNESKYQMAMNGTYTIRIIHLYIHLIITFFIRIEENERI